MILRRELLVGQTLCRDATQKWVASPEEAPRFETEDLRTRQAVVGSRCGGMAGVLALGEMPIFGAGYRCAAC